jgi:two-component system response regulator FlrC
VGHILVTDDEEGIRSFIAEALASEGHQVTLAADGDQAAALLAKQAFHLLLTDLKMPGLDGMDLLKRVRADQPELEVIMLTAHGTVGSAVEAMKLGAFDYLTKPLSGPDELRLVVARALERQRLQRENARMREPDQAGELVAVSPAMLRVVENLRKVAPTDASVLLLGESGTGKEVAARALHRLSRRAAGPFVPVNCAALSETLLESEMFGHERGAFTGALSQRRGRFELADSGTLFLDEVAELRPPLQAKLLRVLQERSFERVGGNRTLSVDVRLVAATNRNLDAERAAGRFREDLYHRLAVFPVQLPPLRERPEDLPELVQRLLQRIGAQIKRPGLSVSEEALQVLGQRAWPGNVRELANVLERAAILAEGPRLTPTHLDPVPPRSGGPGDAAAHPPGTLRELEREAIRQALAAEGGHRKRAATRLGIGLRTLYDKLKEYGLD